MSNNALYRMKRSVKIGTVSFVVCLLLAAALVAVNILAGLLPAKLSKFDVSGSGLTSVSGQTKTFLKDMDEDVTIYWLVEEGMEDEPMKLFLSRYAETGKHITVKTVDPTVDTEFVTKYGADSLAEGGFVVESAKRYKTVDIRRMYLYSNLLFDVLQSGLGQTALSYDQVNTIYDQYGSTILQMLMMQGYVATLEQVQSAQQAVSFCGEAQMTSAVDFVTREYIPHAYVLTGFGSATPTATMQEMWAEMEVEELSLKETQSIPADAGALILLSPTVDMTVAEANLVKAYLNAGGTLILNTSPEAVETCPNIVSLGAEFGLIPLPGEIEEGNTAGFKDNPNQLKPAVSGATMPTDGSVLAFMPNSHAISITTVAGVKASALMTTTNTAQRLSLSDKTTALGEKGVLNVAAMAEKTVTGADGQSTTAYVIWFGSANAFTETAEKVNSAWNSQYHAGMTVQASDSFTSSHASIEAIPLTQNVLDGLTVGWALILGVILSLLIPAGLLITGIVIWAVRRRR